ncbi:uncharacterized protein K489DRAFT_12040 [Dissoconium aciculare CBS 342.82]|uniref:Uncharacterized protein n=1 Tax=Dissoconium aciculare CBS 342.82 TaxID=1314786 RepID=A0A6J3MK11_9PEZI|nr:uncharacterized protein K489DRAFT_12040 [Dissoconium aciculare CBS 342.82]KAF1827287.1 hypothetical protein K489DRAFT_12040 [Dissoconium aciculare CBS 342.82]
MSSLSHLFLLPLMKILQHHHRRSVELFLMIILQPVDDNRSRHPKQFMCCAPRMCLLGMMEWPGDWEMSLAPIQCEATEPEDTPPRAFIPALVSPGNASTQSPWRVVLTCPGAVRSTRGAFHTNRHSLDRIRTCTYPGQMAKKDLQHPTTMVLKGRFLQIELG